MLETDTKAILKSFFNSTDELIEKKIIRSSKYTADVAEYLSQKIYNLKLCDNQREIGFDAIDYQEKKYQIKINNSSQKTNQDIGNTKSYDFLILMITSNSLLFDQSYSDYFIAVYKIDRINLNHEKYVAKKYLQNIAPEYLISKEFEIIGNSNG